MCTSGLDGRHLVFRASGCRGHCLQQYFWRAWMISHGFSTKICVSMCYTIGDSGVTVLLHFEAAILDFWLPVWSESFHTDSFGLLDPKNMGVAVEILLLACLEPEIHLGGKFTPPPWVLTFVKNLGSRRVNVILSCWNKYVLIQILLKLCLLIDFLLFKGST